MPMTTPPASLSVLLAVHNRLHLTQRCLACLRAAAGPRPVRYIVVDDGSTDGTAAWLAAQPDVDVIQGDGELWFGGATDAGLRHILATHPGCRAVLVLNNDTFVRAEALEAMLGAMHGENQVVAGAFWVEDRGLAGSAGFVREPWQGLRDVCVTAPWAGEHRADGRRFLPVDAVATTLTLIPLPVLEKTRLPDPRRHPHNRYDAILSARLGAAGARFICSTHFLADHLYGPMAQRPTARHMTLGRFLHESFANRRSIYHVGGNLALIRETSANPAEAAWGVARQAGRFGRQAAWTALNSLRSRPKPVATAPC